MKDIIIATDFSVNAHVAALCAGELSSRLGGRLIVFHALSPMATVENNSDGNEVYRNLLPEEAAQKKLDLLAMELHNRFEISVSRLLKPGFAEVEIPALAQSLKAELVVTGAQGQNMQTGRTLGSLANKLLNNSTFPVVCLPADSLWNFDRTTSLILLKQFQLCNSFGLTLLNELNSRLSSLPESRKSKDQGAA